MARSTDPNAELSLGEPMGVIPAGTLLRTEFNAVIPEETAEQKTLVSKGLDPNFYESSICIIE